MVEQSIAFGARVPDPSVFKESVMPGNDEAIGRFSPLQRVLAGLLLVVGALTTGFLLGSLISPIEPSGGFAVASLLR